MERVGAANRAVAESASALTRLWAQENPLAAFWQQGMAAFNAARPDATR